MATMNNGIHFFEIENDKKTIFIEDMHDFAILSDNDTLREIHFPNYELAKQHSDRLNAIGKEGLVTKPVGEPWRIYLKTWQDDVSRGVHDFTTQELFDYLINLKIIADDEKFDDWRNERDRMLDICYETNKDEAEEALLNRRAVCDNQDFLP